MYLKYTGKYLFFYFAKRTEHSAKRSLEYLFLPAFSKSEIEHSKSEIKTHLFLPAFYFND